MGGYVFHLLLFFYLGWVYSHAFESEYFFCYGDSLRGSYPDEFENRGCEWGDGGLIGGYYPSSRFNGAGWMDSADEYFYIFGGNGYDMEPNDRINKGIQPLNDVWRYDLLGDNWRIMSGVIGRACGITNWGKIKAEGGVHKLYTLGLCGGQANCVTPGGRESFAYDVQGNGELILFGGYGAVEHAGYGVGRLNDIWKYNPSTNRWWLDEGNYAGQTVVNEETYCGGIPSCNYSHVNVPSSDVRPRSRMESTGKLVKGGTVFAVFGGKFGVDIQLTNEMWYYSNDGSSEWELVAGNIEFPADSERGQIIGGRYDFRSDAHPSARSMVYMWSVFVGGDELLYVLGGLSIAPSSYWQDLWAWHVDDRKWKYISGSKYISENAVIDGGYKIYHSTNNPPARMAGFAFVNPNDQKTLMLFGGIGLKSDGISTGLNDVWAFDTENEKWMWVGGGLDNVGYTNEAGDDRDRIPGHYSGFYAMDSNTADPTIYVFGGFSSVDINECDDKNYEMGMILDFWSFHFVDKCNSSYTFEYNSCNFQGECVYDEPGITHCECVDIYDGDNCELAKVACYGMLEDDPLVCNRRKGDCIDKDWCECTEDFFFGIDCEENIGGVGTKAKATLNKGFLSIPYTVPETWIIGKEGFYLLDSDERNGTFNCSRVLRNPASWYGLNNGAKCSFFFPKGEYHSTKLIVKMGDNYTAEPGDEVLLKAIYPPAKDPYQYTSMFIKRVAAPANYDEYEKRDDDGEDTVITVEGTLAVSAAAAVGLLAAFLVPMLCCLCCFCCCGCIVLCCVFCGMTGFTTLIAYLKRRVNKFSGMIVDNLDVLLLEQDDMFDKNFKKVKFSKKMFNVKFNSLDIQSVIASGGSNSVVYKCKWKGKIVALKLYKTKDLSTQESFDAFADEVAIMKDIKHPNMLDFHGCTLDEPRVGIVIEFCGNGDLRQYIGELDNPRFSTGDKLRILLEIADIMAYLNSLKIVHRDLKSDNVLLNKDLVSKLIDFGLSKVVQNSSAQAYMTKQAGTSQYMAPEVTLSSDYGSKCDVFSFAIMIYEIMTEDFQPYGKFPEFNIELKVALNPDFRPRIEDRMIHKRHEVDWLMDCMKKSWEADPEDRPNFEEIKELVEENREETAESMRDFDEMILKRIEEQRMMRQRLAAKEDDITGGESTKKKKKVKK